MLLTDPIEKLNLVGPAYAKRLSNLQIYTIEDLLYHFPSRYEDFSLISPISKARVGEVLTISAKIDKVENAFTKTGKIIQKASITDASGKMEIVWFNQAYLEKTLKTGQWYNFSGKIEWFGNQKSMISPEYELLRRSAVFPDLPDQSQTVHTGKIIPIYPETYGISSKWLRSRINFVLTVLNNQIQEFLPLELVTGEGLMPEFEALKEVHFPKNSLLAQKALFRMAFDELFLIQLSALLRKKEWERKTIGKKLAINKEKIKEFVSRLPFQLTNAQKRCINEILTDLSREKPMNRLLEGDVGSGKTVVAAVAAYATFLNGQQTLVMAPTEILASQHDATFKKLLEPFKVNIKLITSSQKKAVKKTVPEKKPADIIIGTHALLYNNFNQQTVGLVIVDEQHRFGVEQRALISYKGQSSHFLTMTATPIPRTIALTLFGDLDLSVIDEMPKGRINVKTWTVPQGKRINAYNWIRKKIKDTPQQAFIVCPLIEESESLQAVKAVKKEFETLSKEIFPDLRLALLHGKIKSKEKETVLNDFKEGKRDILVATPLVEVGIDIPNATIMLIEGADRFGLAQLHQLRGRVGRSNLQSYCFLFTENESLGVLQRLKSLEKTNIGMELAEIDLKIRGPGEIYGTRQHGFFNLKAASYTNLELIKKTRKYAELVLNSQFDNLIIGKLNNTPLKLRLDKYKINAINN